MGRVSWLTDLTEWLTWLNWLNWLRFQSVQTDWGRRSHNQQYSKCVCVCVVVVLGSKRCQWIPITLLNWKKRTFQSSCTPSSVIACEGAVLWEREKINHTGRRRRGAETEKRLKSRTGRSYLARFPARLPPSPPPPLFNSFLLPSCN